MADQQGQSQDLGYERLGQKRLKLADVVAQSVGFMGPVFSAAFIIPAIVGANAAAKGAGNAAPLAVLVAAIGVFALGWIVAQYAKRIHAAGSLYDYVSNGLGNMAGATAGWIYYGGTIILTTGLGVLIGGYIHDILLPTWGIDNGLFPIWVWDVIWAVLLFAVLYFGVQISTRVQLTLALISVLVFTIFMISVIVQLGSDNDVARAFKPSSSPDGWSGILFGVLYGVLIFVGFETAANLAEETDEPKKHIPRAVLFSVIVVSIFYLLASYVVVAGYGFDLNAIFEANVAGPALVLLGAPGSGLRLGDDPEDPAAGGVVRHPRGRCGRGGGIHARACSRWRGIAVCPAPLASVSKHGTPVGAIILLMVVQGLLIIADRSSETLLSLPGAPALLLDLHLVRHVRRFRPAGRVPHDVARSHQRPGGRSEPGRADHRGDPRSGDHRGWDLRLVLQGHESIAHSAVGGGDLGRDRLDLHGGGQRPGAREPGPG